MRALRAAMKLPLLSATEARSILPGPAFAATVVARSEEPPLVGERRALPGSGPLGGGEELSPDTNSPEDCLCLAKARASGPGGSLESARTARFNR